jgi:P pilus assembly chaperone PapD
MGGVMKQIFKHPLRALAAFLILLIPAGVAVAYEVEPMRMILDLGAGRTTAVINIRNTREEALPVEIVMKRRIVHADGSQEFVPAEEDFSIFPPLALIQPGQSQAIRISYIGDPAVRDSQAYVAEVQEVPVSREDFTGVVFAYNFGVAVYVRANEAQADISLAEVRETPEGLALRVTNAGTDFAMLGELDLRIRAGGETVRLSPAQVAELVENPIIPPHASRDFLLGIDGLPAGAVEVSLGRSF